MRRRMRRSDPRTSAVVQWSVKDVLRLGRLRAGVSINPGVTLRASSSLGGSVVVHSAKGRSRWRPRRTGSAFRVAGLGSLARIASAATGDLSWVVAVQRGITRAGGRSRTRTLLLARLGPGR